MTFVVAVMATSALTPSGLAVGGTLKVLSSVFENLRRSLDEMLARATRPEDRRLIMARMKGTLVQARLGVDDLRDALAQTRRKLEHPAKMPDAKCAAGVGRMGDPLRPVGAGEHSRSGVRSEQRGECDAAQQKQPGNR